MTAILRRRPGATALALFALMCVTVWLLQIPIFKSPRYAIVTYLDETGDDSDVHYFEATRMLTYQVLYDQKTRIRASHVDWVVAVSDNVKSDKISRLRKDGAIVRHLGHIPSDIKIDNGEARWKNVIDKLRLWEWTEYTRIMYLDADAVIQSQLEIIFLHDEVVYPHAVELVDHLHVRTPNDYVFLTRPDTAYLSSNSSVIDANTSNWTQYMNAGFFVFMPSHDMYRYFLALLRLQDRPFDTRLPEQNVLNFAFRHCQGGGQLGYNCASDAPAAPMPWTDAGSIWTSNRVNQGDYEAGVRVLHFKGWELDANDKLRAVWDSVRTTALTFLDKR